MTGVLKFIAALLLEYVALIIIVVLSIFYLNYIPEHWGKLTLLTVFVVLWFSSDIYGKLMRRKKK